jgi:hypothetical protein
MVLVGPYWNLQYDAPTWADPIYEGRFGKFNLPGDELVRAYNLEIAQLAAEFDTLFVDVYAMLEGASWLLNDDGCHFNDVGQAIIGMKVFCEVAAHCSFAAARSQAMEEQLRLTIWNTGGTEALPHVISTWRAVQSWAA